MTFDPTRLIHLKGYMFSFFRKESAHNLTSTIIWPGKYHNGGYWFYKSNNNVSIGYLINSAFHSSGVGKWVPTLAGKVNK